MSRSWTLAWMSVVVAVVGGLWLPVVNAQATKPKTKPPIAADDKAQQDEEQPDRFAVPQEATVEELVSFLTELKSFRPTSRAELMAFRKQGPQSMKAAAEQIQKLEKDPKSAAFRLANGLLLQLEAGGLREATPADKAAFFMKAKEHLANSDKTAEDLSLAMNVAMGLEYGEARDLAAKAYTEFGELLSKSKETEVAEQAEVLIGAGRRMNLIGKPLELTGSTLAGKKFDVKNLRGKVVLVDFWATWCGPCLAEYPNIKENFEAYHDKGFEVVGVSLDQDRDALEKYVEETQVPWTTLHEKEAGGRHPAATYYGILGIPAVIMVNKEGNVISLDARGEQLGKLLEQELGPVEKKETE